MNFDYSEEQQLLADSVRRFLDKQYGFEDRKKIIAGQGWSDEVWAKLAVMGLTGLPISPDYGGFGGGAVDLMSVMEAFGEALVVEPLLPTLVAARLVGRAGSEAQKKAILPAVAEGRLRLAFAASPRGNVLGAPGAGTLVVQDGADLYLVDAANVRMKPYRTLDNMAAAEIDCSVSKGDPLVKNGKNHLEEALDFATALVCAEAVGAMKFACDTTLEYLKTRKQFGVPIGTFQALQHRIVDMYISEEQARSMVCLACSKVDANEGPADRARAVSAAKIRIGDAARHVSQESVQLHGGMGMSEELKVSHAFRRLTVIARQFGDADHHLERFASL
ncbi:MAG TPA: acyl-CoA dehydrogenase [Burkholderiales bacterium]|nr:acyl-CoA dehydrogenase [Burkholderiales bacterium]